MRRTSSDQAYLLNSGSEACEAAIKLARKWGQLHRGGASRIIVAKQGCHGRSLATISASDSCNLHNRFAPLLPGFDLVPFNDLPALHAAVDAQTVAIMLEPIQSDAGVIPATEHYLKGVERLCRELGILLILDEVQTGIGRCGTLLAEQSYGVRADIVVLGKGLGGGVPLAALLARGKACCFEAGELGGTHHGNALMTAAGLVVLDSVHDRSFLEQVNDNGQHLREGLARLAHRYDHGELRGQGLLLRTDPVGRFRRRRGPRRAVRRPAAQRPASRLPALHPGAHRQQSQHRRNAPAPGPRLLPRAHRTTAMPQRDCRLS